MSNELLEKSIGQLEKKHNGLHAGNALYKTLHNFSDVFEQDIKESISTNSQKAFLTKLNELIVTIEDVGAGTEEVIETVKSSNGVLVE